MRLKRLRRPASPPLLVVRLAAASSARANSTPQTLPFSQDWTNIGLITANDRLVGGAGDRRASAGDDITTATGIGPADAARAGRRPGVLDVNANQSGPDVVRRPGGVAEFRPAPARRSRVTGSGHGRCAPTSSST